MSFEPTDVYVKTEENDPVEGVLVKIYNQAGDTFFTQGSTDVDGKASFLLETLDYSMRFYKFQASFTQPQYFTVLPAPDTNAFDVLVKLFELPIATDPRLCRCSGYFRDLDGSPKQWLDIHVIAEFDPIILDDAGVVTDEKHFRTNEDGYISFDLIRGGNYYVNMEALGATGLRRLCRVPDAASAYLPHMLFPVVDRVTFDPVAPFSVAVDLDVEVTPTVYDSAGRPLIGTARDDVLWESEDESIFTVIVGETTLTLRGISAGTTNLLASRKNTSIIRIPDTPIVGVPAEVTTA